MATPTPTTGFPSTIFPNWARIVLGLVVAFGGYLTAGEVVEDPTLKGIIAVTLTIMASAGIVPPRASDLHMSAPVALALTVLASVLSYIVTAEGFGLDLGATVKGIIVAVINVAAVVGIRPPQISPPR